MTSARQRLGNLPDALTFIYDQSQDKMSPASGQPAAAQCRLRRVLNWQAIAGDRWINPQTGSGAPRGNLLRLRPADRGAE